MVVMNYKAGQLANRLFYFAHFVSNSVEYDYELINPSFDDYKDYFIATAKNDFEGLKVSIGISQNSSLDSFLRKSINVLHKVLLPPLRETSFYYFHSIKENDRNDVDFDMNQPNFIEAAKQKTVFVDGWLYRDPKNFKKHASTLRKVFTPQPKYTDEVCQIIDRCRLQGDLVVGIHIRRGDYKAYNNGYWYYEDEVYREKMKALEKSISVDGRKCVFLVCSNEPINKANYEGLEIVADNRHFMVDLYALAKCDYIMGPPSTFTMWASFYGQVPLLTLDSRYKQVDLADFYIVTKG
ncbi:hypothetical protein CLV24_11132 [Pontibacter ummariensis]|uniref:Glycosyl transferase family 11 n=1 Tax=Pontibacter ummariensis TaxID=1610492 RepID=A0A239GF64_9BACT|nr:hypothetical protein [Pontibacter ummariensis]PRY11237.1 hypothetical protein CLV24_11132 [Pontibacter ummariensis]SNS67779.1 hypothetical protein SAMN06296052_11132 [Pontibacter ummariensis]